jgi:hypothetical protein
MRGRPTTTGRGRTAGAREARAWLNADEWAALTARVEAEGATMGDVLRRAIAAYLATVVG